MIAYNRSNFIFERVGCKVLIMKKEIPIEHIFLSSISTASLVFSGYFYLSDGFSKNILFFGGFSFILIKTAYLYHV